MKTILLLTDFSKSATNAIHYAMRFFESESCTFHIMNVHKVGTFISDDLMSSSTESIYESFTKVPKQKIDELINELKQTYRNEKHEFKTIVDFDVFTDAVNQAITKHEVDFVVMGSNGATGAKEIIFGSNTVNVIRNVMCKTLVIPNDYKFKTISNVLLPLQVDDNLKPHLLEVIKNYSKHFNYKIHVLRTLKSESVSNHLPDDKALLKTLDCEYTTQNEVSFYQAVINYLNTYQIDMVGLIVHDKSFIKRFFTETPTIQLSKVIQLPLLLFHVN